MRALGRWSVPLLAQAVGPARAAIPAGVGLQGAPLADPGLRPICGNYACARPPPRDPWEPSQPLLETGGWGFSYGPLPLSTPGTFPDDDLMASWMRAQFSWDGRNDLGIMHQMGAKVIRMYGNDPRFPAGFFLDQANGWGMKVIAGISDYPYIQSKGCVLNQNLSCYDKLNSTYTMMLESGGFLIQRPNSDREEYHPALEALIIMNEPELKIIDSDGELSPDYIKVLLSAFDGILAAEKARGIDITSKDNIKFTATWSYSTCPTCPNIMKLKGMGCCLPCSGELCEKYGDAGKPAEEGGMRCPASRKPHSGDDCPVLPMIMDFYTAIEDPSSVGYEFKTEGWKEAYQSRWVHSVNAFVSAESLSEQFISKYKEMPFNKGKTKRDWVPLFLGEFGDPLYKDPAMLKKDIRSMIRMVKSDQNPLFAFNVFEFQVSYWKPCSDEGNEEWNSWLSKYWSNPKRAPNFPSDCSERAFGIFSLGNIPVGKTGKVALSGEEYVVNCLKPIFKGKPEAIATAFGGTAPDTLICERGWEAKPEQYCVSTRGDPGSMGAGVEWACGELQQMGRDCMEGLPAYCEGDGNYSVADWVFSTYFELNRAKGATASDICSFGGAAVVTALPPRQECTLTSGPTVVPPKTTPRPTTTTTTSTTTSGGSPWETTTRDPEQALPVVKAALAAGGVLVLAAAGVGIAFALCRPQALRPARQPDLVEMT